MGFGDKLKGLRDQAQQAVADNKDRIQGAVQVVGEAANSKTSGKYAGKIAKVGERVSEGVERLAKPGDADTPADAGAPAAGAQHGEATPHAVDNPATGSPPEFE